LMTPEPVIEHPLATVAHALARLREPELPAAIAAQVFVTERPTQPPTGLYLGAVGFQRLLREAPGNQVGRCLDEHPDPIGPDLAEVAVAERLAAYNLLAVPVCDAAGRLLGAVTGLRWDPYPFILLNLVFSTQAAYAAPLILLAQNRQADRDRAQAETDRAVNARTQADTEFLARELASVRLALAGVATTEDLTSAVERLTATVERLASQPPN